MSCVRSQPHFAVVALWFWPVFMCCTISGSWLCNLPSSEFWEVTGSESPASLLRVTSKWLPWVTPCH